MAKKVLKDFFVFNLLTIVCATFLYFTVGLFFFPNEIKIMQGRSLNVSYGIPFSATIETDAVTVLNVNDNRVTDNITVNLNDETELKADSEGKAKLTLSAFGIPLKKTNLDILPDLEVVPCGNTIGVRINTDGVLVLGTGFVKTDTGSSVNPSDGILKSGDLILTANGTEVRSKEHLQDIIRGSGESIDLKIKRGDSIINCSIKTVKGNEDKLSKIGVWVRDSTHGIGTLTYYNPQTKKFAALGHGIADVDTKKLMSIKSGDIMNSEVVSIKKGRKGAPGELEGNKTMKKIIGEVKLNNSCGIYGVVNTEGLEKLSRDTVKIQTQDQVHEGPAKIRSNVERDEVKEYDIYIESVNRYSLDDTRGMVIRITDPELLSKTGGIVQGMSGSPILQDGNLIGAVTHVFVQEPSKGYGIFIENMLKQEKMI